MMNCARQRRYVWALALAAAWPAASATAQNSSLYKRERALRAQPVAAPATVAAPVSAASIVAPPKAPKQTFGKHDLLTIVIREEATNATNSAVKTSRDTTVDGKMDAFSYFKPSDFSLRAAKFPSGTPALKGELKRGFDSTGTDTRTDSLTARIQAEIIDIKPNGNLVLQASKLVQTDEETYTITVTGVCRTQERHAGQQRPVHAGQRPSGGQEGHRRRQGRHEARLGPAAVRLGEHPVEA